MTVEQNGLGEFLKDRRARLDPASLGFSVSRRRTTGLRREEVAQRANVSPTWYTWLEQGRHGVPSADVLERLARALELSPAEREHMFLIAQRRPPEIRYAPQASVTPELQRMLDALAATPAFIKTAAWDIVAWNHAAARVLTDYGALPPGERNLLRLLFADPALRARSPQWESQARHVVATFRLQTSRAGATDAARVLIEEMIESSPNFAAMWNDNDVSAHGTGTKHIVHPTLGPLVLDYASFAVDGQPDLTLVIYTPATPDDAQHVRSLIENS